MAIYVYMVSYIAAFILSELKFYIPSGIVLLISAVFLCFQEYRRMKMFVNLRGLFTLSFVGGQAFSCMKLSNLQTDWSAVTWIAFFLAFIIFWYIYEFLSMQLGRIERKARRRNGVRVNTDHLFLSGVMITGLSLAAFGVEAYVLGFIPLFVQGVPHAYSAFHISGVHYITVGCVLVPSIAVVYFHQKRGDLDSESMFFFGTVLVALLIPILCVSRFQFVFSVLLAVLTYLAIYLGKREWLLAVGWVALLPVYLILTVARSHDAAYLNSIFEMKYGLPVYVGQPYIYIANNYDNFNRMVERLPSFSFGMKSLFPLWALTGLKKIFPTLVNYPLFVTKEELTTLTLFYDAYYDFGLIGILLLSGILGAVSYFIEDELKEAHNPAAYIFYAQFAAYFCLAFFTTWFSNPTTWFYFILTALVYIYAGKTNRRRSYRRY